MVGSSRVDDSHYISDIENPLPLSTLEPHKVCVPPSVGTFKALRQRLSEIFFPDDPFREFKNHTLQRKLILAIHYLFPILQWVSNYNPKHLKSDVIAGITIASLAIPQGISYAKLASLPPITGLYSSFVPPLVYAVVGSSRDLAVGPVSIASLVMGAMLRDIVSPVQEPILYLQLAFTATFFAGLFQASLGILRLGFIIDFLSRATLTGFMAGAAIIVSLQQLKGLLGIVHFTNQMGFVPVMVSVFKHTKEWSWQTILMGVCFLVFLLTARCIALRKPKLFWVSAAAPLVSVALSTIVVFIFKADEHSIQTIGYLPKGINPPSASMLYFHGPFLGLAIRTGILTGILSLTEGIAVGRTFASLKNYQVDGNKEMMAIGLMNMAGSCCSSYITTGSFSRSAVNYNAGSKSALSNIVMAATVLFTLLFLMPLFYYTPNVILAVIIITAVIGLIDLGAACQLWKVDKFDFFSCIIAFLGVLFISVQMGLALAVGISLLRILLHVTRPNIVVLGNIPGTQTYQNVAHYHDAVQISPFLVLSMESPIYFANCTYLQERVMRLVREEELNRRNKGEVKYVILEMRAVTTIDTSGLEALLDLKKALEKRELKLILTSPLGDVMKKLHHSNALDSMFDCIYLTTGEAIAVISSELKETL